VSAFLSDAILANLIALEESDLPDTCTIYRPPVASIADLGEEPDSTYPTNWTAIGTGISCNLTARNSMARELALGGRASAVGEWIITLPAGTTVAATDRIRITSLSNRDFEVVSVLAGSYEVSRQVEAKEIL
jgi:hypothetical protein